MHRVEARDNTIDKKLKKFKSNKAIIEGYQLFHNYIRTHQGLDGKTPADLCGIKIKGKNKWITLIQNASTKI